MIVGVVYSVLPHWVRYETLRAQGERYVPLTQESHFDYFNVHAARYRDMIDGRILSGKGRNCKTNNFNSVKDDGGI